MPMTTKPRDRAKAPPVRPLLSVAEAGRLLGLWKSATYARR
jgi:hypothetical protein